MHNISHCEVLIKMDDDIDKIAVMGKVSIITTLDGNAELVLLRSMRRARSLRFRIWFELDIDHWSWLLPAIICVWSSKLRCIQVTGIWEWMEESAKTLSGMIYWRFLIRIYTQQISGIDENWQQQIYGRYKL